MLDDILKTYDVMAREIERREPLLRVGQPNDDTWARDHGFVTLVSDDPQDAPLLLDFCFNGWGMKFAADKDNCITRNLFSSYKDFFLPSVKYGNCLDFVLEGGSVESDGQGTLLVTSQCLLSVNRNEHYLPEEIESQLKRRLGADNVLWLNNGNIDGDDTDGHIDTLARFCSPDTIAYVAPPEDENDEDYYDFCMMEDELKAFRTKDGEPYKLVPLPYLSYELDGEPQPATYANFLIMNKAVLVPVYGLPTDEAALSAIGDAFPDREVVGIDCRPLVQQHGSLHCVTMQYPAGFFLPTRK
jgi:agmatine/peptidylarginine deiminase